MTRFTFEDVINHGLDYLGGNPNAQATRDCVRAADEAYRDLANAFTWKYLYTQGRIVTSAAIDSASDESSLTYTHTGGAYERMATLAGSTWPDWAGDAFVRIGDVAYKVDERKSATVITFTDSLNPGADLPAGTEFTLYRDTFPLPEDFIAQDQALYEQHFGGMNYTHPSEWLYETRYVFAQGVPQFFTITGDQKYPGRLVLRVFPWPTESKTIAFIYKRRPRALRLVRESAGKITVTNGSNAVTGVGTVFSPRMVGSVIRISANGTAPPTSLIMGTNVAVFESIVAAYVSPTSIMLADPLDAGYTSVCYTISDPVDIEPGAMLNAYLRCVEKHLGMNRTLKDKPSARAQYLEALAEAKSADSRSFMGESVGSGGRQRMRLRDMPMGPDEP